MSKEMEVGGGLYWFQCTCGYRYMGSTQSAKTMAFRLHQKKCEMAKRDKLNNTEFDPIPGHKQKSQVVDGIIESMEKSL